MSTKVILASSAVFLGVCGIAGLFLPQELLRFSGVAPAGILTVAIQLLAALLFAFSMVNWTARGSLIGGIYNRPIAIGNLTHFVIGALTLGKAVFAGERRVFVIVLTAVYVVFAIAFIAVFRRSPVRTQGNP